MNKKELIEGIQNLEFESEDGAYQRGFDSAKYWCLTLASNLDESEAEKVEVTECVAEWFETNKGNLEHQVWVYIDDYDNQPDTEFSEWISNEHNRPLETLFRMKDGYTIKPKKWVVKKGRDCVLTNFTFLREDLVNYDSNSYGKDYLYFTDKAKAAAVAVLVEGTVEEV